jgi:hypothetical protein
MIEIFLRRMQSILDVLSVVSAFSYITLGRSFIIQDHPGSHDNTAALTRCHTRGEFGADFCLLGNPNMVIG